MHTQGMTAYQEPCVTLLRVRCGLTRQRVVGVAREPCASSLLPAPSLHFQHHLYTYSAIFAVPAPSLHFQHRPASGLRAHHCAARRPGAGGRTCCSANPCPGHMQPSAATGMLVCGVTRCAYSRLLTGCWRCGALRVFPSHMYNLRAFAVFFCCSGCWRCGALRVAEGVVRVAGDAVLPHHHSSSTAAKEVAVAVVAIAMLVPGVMMPALRSATQ
jgi:hypothetical protein